MNGWVVIKDLVLIILCVINIDIGIYFCKVVNFVGDVIVNFNVIIFGVVLVLSCIFFIVYRFGVF